MAKKDNILFKLRFYTAGFSTILLNLNVFGISLRSFCSPGFNCHGCPWATFACPIGVMSFSSGIRQLPLLAISFVLAIGIIFGRLVCGFICPFGWFQDLLYKIPGAKIKLPRFMNWFKYGFLILFVFLLPYIFGFEQSGYLFLPDPEIDKGEPGMLKVTVSLENRGKKTVETPSVIVVYIDNETKEEIYRKTHIFPDVSIHPGETVTLPLIDAPNNLSTANLLLSSPQSTVLQKPRYNLYFCKICPTGTLTASLPAKIGRVSGGEIYGGSSWFSLRFIILYFFIVLMILSSRPFCRIMCPLGAIYGLTAKVSLSRFKVDKNTCVNCGLCDTVCPVGLDVRKDVGGMECIACGDCIRKCPKNSITRRFISN
jgi:polyferredoxin